MSYKTVNSWILLFPPSSLPHLTGGGSEPAAVLCLAACWIKPWHPCMDRLPTGPLLRYQGSGELRAEAEPPSFTLVVPQFGCCCQFAAVSQWQLSASSFSVLPRSDLSLQLCRRLCLHGQAPTVVHQAGWVRLPPALVGCPRSMAQGRPSWPFMGTSKV